MAAAQVAHWLLPQPQKPTHRQNPKSHFTPRFEEKVYLKNLILRTEY